MPTYKFKFLFTKNGQAYAPTVTPTLTVVDSANTVLVNAGAVTALSNLVGVYLGSYTGAAADCIGRCSTTDPLADQMDVFDYTPQVITDYLTASVADVKTQTDKIPASPAAVGDAMTLTSAYDAAKLAATAAQVWEYVTRTLTSGGGVTAEDIWNYTNRTITQVSAVSAGALVVYNPADSAVIRFAYCTLDELVRDLELSTANDDILERFIIPATQYVLREIGPFIPVYEQKLLQGSGGTRMSVPPLTTIVAISNDGVELSASDYQLGPSDRMWMYGPYIKIDCDLDTSTIAAWDDARDGVQLTAAFSLWEQTAKTGATLAVTLDNDDETLVASDGSKLSPGAVLLLDSEMLFVTGSDEPSAAVTSLAADCAAGDNVLTVASAASINIGEVIRVDFEDFKVLRKSGNRLNVVPGWNNTTKSAHTSSADVDVYRAFRVERAINGTSAGGHTSGAVIKRYKTPEDINYLTRQIAALMLKKSQTGYAGRSGNADGETFYNFEFPRDAIERIKRNYYIPRVG